MKHTVDGWSIKWLSQGGKKVFIKSVLQVIPLYAMTFFLPNSLCKDFERIMANFWWHKGFIGASGKKFVIPRKTVG